MGRKYPRFKEWIWAPFVVVDMCSGNHFKGEFFCLFVFSMTMVSLTVRSIFSLPFFLLLFLCLFFSFSFFSFFFLHMFSFCKMCSVSHVESVRKELFVSVCTAGVGIGLVYHLLMAHGKKHWCQSFLANCFSKIFWTLYHCNLYSGLL